MSKVLLNRLAMFEVLDQTGACTVTELAKLSGLDVSVVSRTVAACERDGWIHREGSRVMLGPRATLLGNGNRFARIMASAGPIVHAVAGVTGLTTHAYALVGGDTVAIAVAAGRGQAALYGLVIKAPLHATAGGRAIAVQLDPQQLARVLPDEPYPSAAAILAGAPESAMLAVSRSLAAGRSPAPLEPAADGSGRTPSGAPPEPLPTTLEELRKQLERTRADGFATDHGTLVAGIHCIAVPWPQPPMSAALTCIGPADAVNANVGLVVHTLLEAAKPGATPASILAASTRAPE